MYYYLRICLTSLVYTLYSWCDDVNWLHTLISNPQLPIYPPSTTRVLQPFALPEGLQIAAEPDASLLVYESGATNLKVRQALDNRYILFHWAVVGWCVGTLTANTDGRRKKVDGKCPNFWAYYEVDREERIHSLTLSAYGQGGKGSWVLLEPVA